MKTYLLIVLGILFLSYTATTIILFDIFWINDIGNWTPSERFNIVAFFFMICIISKGIQLMHFDEEIKNPPS